MAAGGKLRSANEKPAWATRLRGGERWQRSGSCHREWGQLMLCSKLGWPRSTGKFHKRETLLVSKIFTFGTMLFSPSSLLLSFFNLSF